jgi:hypothetical protein
MRYLGDARAYAMYNCCESRPLLNQAVIHIASFGSSGMPIPVGAVLAICWGALAGRRDKRSRAQVCAIAELTQSRFDSGFQIVSMSIATTYVCWMRMELE